MTGTRDVTVNGAVSRVVPNHRFLADHLRDTLGLRSVKIACARGECGSCTVLHGDRPVASCILPVELVSQPVTTLEAVAEATRPLRALMADNAAFQCGFCTPGQIMNALAILRRPVGASAGDRDDVRRQMAGNICRCTGYVGLVNTITAALDDRQSYQVGR